MVAIRSLCLALALALVSACASTPERSGSTAAAAKWAGSWKGVYRYEPSEAPGSQTEVPFEATIKTEGTKTKGEILETTLEGLAPGKPVKRRAVVEEIRFSDDGTVDFVKWYDGAAGWNHPVVYVGRVAGPSDRPVLKGHWHIPPARGAFEMTKQKD